MKKHFPAYYRIHRDTLSKDFENCFLVFDTNALLDIYRLPQESAKQVFEVLEHYKDQIRIPHHTAKEYYNDIHGVLRSQISNIEKAQSGLEELMKMLSNRRNQPYISDRSNRHLTTLKNSITRDFTEQKDYLTNQLLYGEYQNKMAELLDGCVLDSFSDAEITAIEKEGEERYKSHVSPGWKDADKGSNRYGDLIIWKEILRLAQEQKKSILYISNDQKEDWMLKEKGMTICPQYDLLAEFYNEVGDPKLWFHIYTLDRFLDFVNEKGTAKVSKETVEQVRETVSKTFWADSALPDYWKYLADMQTNSVYSKIAESLKAMPDVFRYQDQLQDLYTKTNYFNLAELMASQYKSQSLLESGERMKIAMQPLASYSSPEVYSQDVDKAPSNKGKDDL